MSRLTLKKVNAALPPGFELVRAHEGYFYFAGEALNWHGSSVMVFRLNDLTLEQWLEEFEDLRKKGERR